MRHRSSILLFYSSDETEFIRRFPAKAITHGFTRRRPIRSLKIPPEVRKSPTDFTDIHRFFIGVFFSHADFADDADFIHRMTRNLFGDFLLTRLLTDFHGCDLSGRCRYPLRLTKRFTRDSIKNLCISVKSVGQKNNRSIYRAPAIGQRPKFCEIP